MSVIVIGVTGVEVEPYIQQIARVTPPMVLGESSSYTVDVALTIPLTCFNRRGELLIWHRGPFVLDSIAGRETFCDSHPITRVTNARPDRYLSQNGNPAVARLRVGEVIDREYELADEADLTVTGPDPSPLALDQAEGVIHRLKITGFKTKHNGVARAYILRLNLKSHVGATVLARTQKAIFPFYSSTKLIWEAKMEARRFRQNPREDLTDDANTWLDWAERGFRRYAASERPTHDMVIALNPAATDIFDYQIDGPTRPSDAWIIERDFDARGGIARDSTVFDYRSFEDPSDRFAMYVHRIDGLARFSPLRQLVERLPDQFDPKEYLDQRILNMVKVS